MELRASDCDVSDIVQDVPISAIQHWCIITQKAENLQCYNIYNKMQYMFRFYLQIFTALQCGFLVSRARCPIFKQFLPKSYEPCPHLWSQPLLLFVPVFLPNLQEAVEQTLSQTYPHTVIFRGVKSGDRGGQAIVPPLPIQATTV